MLRTERNQRLASLSAPKQNDDSYPNDDETGGRHMVPLSTGHHRIKVIRAFSGRRPAASGLTSFCGGWQERRRTEMLTR